MTLQHVFWVTAKTDSSVVFGNHVSETTRASVTSIIILFRNVAQSLPKYNYSRHFNKIIVVIFYSADYRYKKYDVFFLSKTFENTRAEFSSLSNGTDSTVNSRLDIKTHTQHSCYWRESPLGQALRRLSTITIITAGAINEHHNYMSSTLIIIINTRA